MPEPPEHLIYSLYKVCFFGLPPIFTIRIYPEMKAKEVKCSAVNISTSVDLCQDNEMKLGESKEIHYNSCLLLPSLREIITLFYLQTSIFPSFVSRRTMAFSGLVIYY